MKNSLIDRRGFLQTSGLALALPLISPGLCGASANGEKRRLQHASGIGDRMAVEILRSGVIGKIRHVHLCANRAGAERFRLANPPLQPGPAPAHFDWDKWVGTVAVRVPDTLLQWDAPAMKIPNHPAAEALLRRDYRDGWKVEGLG